MITSQMKKRNLLILLVTALVVVAAVGLLVEMMVQSVNSSVYAERKELLGSLVESSASIVNDTIEYGQSVADIITDCAAHDLLRYENISAYIQANKDRSGFTEQVYFFVDRNGKYYSSDGVFGKIVDTTYYTDTTADKLTYISSLPHLGTEKAYLIFRNRLPGALRISAGEKTAEILYVGILYDIDTLNDDISREFAGENNTFIYNDTTGVMLYKNFGIKLLIDGFSIYPKFSECEVTFGEDPAELEQSCRDCKTVVVSLQINNAEYYFCSAPVEPEDWSVAFVVQEKYFDTITGSAFKKIILYVSLIAVVLGAAVLTVVVAAYKTVAASRSLKKITELNEKLENATNAKSDFLSNMSHDIRTPINGIMGMTTIAKGVEGNPEKTTECLNKIEGASHHLLSLINDVLDMSRIERGKTEIAAQPIDIRLISENCCSIIRGQMAGRALELITEIDCEHTNLIGDDLHLRQIFINILGNAVKFTLDGGSIWFRCKELESDDTSATLRFEIEDTGIGMKPEFVSKVFDAFSQDDGGARSKYKGTGLGMAITKQLTELMNGKIEVESELGKGSKFTVTIPFIINTKQSEKAQETETAKDIHGVRLLLAEDNDLNMEIAVELLKDAGAEVVGVTDGKQALDAIADSAPGTYDAILMDVMMPVMNGLEATRAIRALPREDARLIPILAMTANAFASDIQQTLEAGMNAHISKPIDVDEMIKTIAHYTKNSEVTGK